MHRKSISLKGIARTHRAEIESILAGIERKPGSALWTTELRANTRGGKCLVTTVSRSARSVNSPAK